MTWSTCRSVIVRGSKLMRCSKMPPMPWRSRAMIQPSSTIISSITRPSVNVARQTAVYLRLGTPWETRNFRHGSGRTLARRLCGGTLECISGGDVAGLVFGFVDLVGGVDGGPDARGVGCV